MTIGQRVQHHRLATFFVLAFVVSWTPWALYSVGLAPGTPFFPGGPLIAALVVIAIGDGRRGFRDLGTRLIRWRVGWVWYVVALGLPVLMVLVTGVFTFWLGAPPPAFSGIVWADVALMLAWRMVDVTDGPAGEEPGWRGYALPHLQSRLSPLSAATVLGVLVAAWHFPLVPLGNLGWIGLPSTVAITFLYVWVFNRSGGSLLIAMLFHASQGALTFGMLGFTGAHEERAAFVYFGVLAIAVAAVVGLDRAAWRSAPAAAVNGTSSLRRAGVTAAAAVILLAGCSGGRSATDSASSPADSSPAETAASSGHEDICARAAGSTSGSTRRYPISRATIRRLCVRSARSPRSCAPSTHPTRSPSTGTRWRAAWIGWPTRSPTSTSPTQIPLRRSRRRKVT